MRRLIWQLLAVPVFLVGFVISASAFTLDMVKQRDELNCGVVSGVPGFSTTDEMGRWQGINVDICRAIAAVTLGDRDKVKYVALTEKTQLTALLSGRVDVLSMNIPWTLTLDTSLGLHVVGVTYYGGQSFMVRKRLGIKSALQLEGATVCLQKGTEEETQLADYFREHDIRYKSIGLDNLQQAAREFVNGSCEVITGDRSRLHSLRLSFDRADDFLVLPEVISREPLGPIVRQGDDGWFTIVRWTLFAMLVAEEYGLAADNVDAALNSTDPRIRTFLGLQGTTGKGLGLDDRWAYRIIKQVGNYAEVFEGNIGQHSALKMDRGLNALWNRGGLHYAPALH